MNQVFETRSPRDGWNHARANRDDWNAEHFNSTKFLKCLQARRFCNIIGCTEATAYTLALLAYGEGRS